MFGKSNLRGVVNCLLFFALGLGTSACRDAFSSDAEMEANFNAHAADFRQLVEMAEADRNVVRIARDFTWPSNANQTGALSDERWDEYRRLFAKLGLKNGLMRYEETGRVFLIAESQGLVTGGSSKGYVYSRTEPAPLVGSLENLNLKSIKGNRAFKRLAEEWYLVFEWE